MSTPFDPYFKWLGIPAEERPVDFYRLLGIERFEADPDVIANAVDQRTGHVKTFRTGRHERAALRILNEIGSARVCLLDPETKAQYDTKLRTTLGIKATPRKPPTLPPRDRTGVDQAGQTGEESAPRKTLAVALGIGGGLGVLIVLGVLWIWRSGNGGEVARQEPPIEHIDPLLPVAKPEEPEGTETAPKEPEPKETLPEKPPIDPPPENPFLEKPEPKEQPPENPKPTDPAPKDKPEPKPDDDQGVFKPVKVRLPEPDEPSRRKAEAMVREVFFEVGGGRRTKQQTLELADKLYRSGLETKDDPAARFVLLRMAAQVAATTGEMDRTFAMVDQLTREYDVNLVGVKAEALEKSCQGAGSGPAAMLANMSIVRNAELLLDDALAADDYPVASRVLDQIAVPASRRAGNRRLTVELTKRRAGIKRQRDAYAKVEAAMAVLAQDPDNAEANAAVGRWHCLIKGQWEKGLPFLAKAGDPNLVSPAQQDLALPKEAALQAKLADAWWNLGEADGLKENAIANLRARAVLWYRKALPDLTGLVKRQARQRIEESGETVGDHVLVFDGKSGFVGIPNFAYGGTVPITVEAFVTPASVDGTMTVLGNFPRDTRSHEQRGGLRIGLQRRHWDFEMYATSRDSSHPSACHLQDDERATIGARVHVAGVFAGQEMGLFVNGRLVESRNDVARHRPSAYPFLVGADPVKARSTDPLTTQNHFDGVIEAVRISNIPRYTKDGFTPPARLTLDRSTLLLLEFNRGKGDTVANAAASAHAAKIVEAKWMEKQEWHEILKTRIPPERPEFRDRPPRQRPDRDNRRRPAME